MENKQEIEKAIKLLRKNGYVIKKITKSMEKAATMCESMQEEGEFVDCCSCPCSICIMQ